jgi:hypothetical protein
MKPDDFEKRLQREPLRQIPSEWRRQILSEAQNAIRNSKPEARNGFWASLLWPHPKAWAALAGLWTAIAALQFAASDPVQTAKIVAPPSDDTLIVLRQQTRMMAELIGQTPQHEADRPKPSQFTPRSERRGELIFI